MSMNFNPSGRIAGLLAAAAGLFHREKGPRITVSHYTPSEYTGAHGRKGTYSRNRSEGRRRSAFTTGFRGFERLHGAPPRGPRLCDGEPEPGRVPNRYAGYQVRIRYGRILIPSSAGPNQYNALKDLAGRAELGTEVGP